MNETRVTIHGNVVTEPVVRETRTGGVFTTFRIATTPVRRTAEGKFVDGETSFYGVIAFNALGANVGASLHKGQPVVVEGKLSTREWQGSDGQLRQSTEIDAEHVGHDLAWGRGRFERLSRAAALGQDRLSDPEVAHALRAVAGDHDPGLAQYDDRRPVGVDANGEVDLEVYASNPSGQAGGADGAEGAGGADGTDGADGADGAKGADEGDGSDGGQAAGAGTSYAFGDPETDDYEVRSPLSA